MGPQTLFFILTNTKPIFLMDIVNWNYEIPTVYHPFNHIDKLWSGPIFDVVRIDDRLCIKEAFVNEASKSVVGLWEPQFELMS